MRGLIDNIDTCSPLNIDLGAKMDSAGQKVYRKKLTFVVSYANEFGGIQTVNELLLNMLASSGEYDITLLSVFKGDNPLFLKLDKSIAVKYLFDDKSFDVRINLPRVVIAFRRFFKSMPRQDLVVVSDPAFSPAMAFAVPSSVPVIYWDHASFNHGKRFGLTWLGRRLACRLKNSSIVSISEKSKCSYLSEIGRSVRVRRIYNPISWGLSDCEYNADSRKIITCMRLSREKGCDYLLDIAKTVLPKHPDWSWDVYGDGPEYANMAEKIREYSLVGKLNLMGYSSNLKDIIGGYAFYVMTSRYEGFGLALTEAQSRKLPCVSFDCDSGPREIISNGESGFLAKCFSVDEMSQKISILMCDSALRKRMSESAYESAKRFSPQKFFLEWKTCIDCRINGAKY